MSKEPGAVQGIEAQKQAVARFVEAEGLELAGSYTEIETGKGSDALDRRPQLAAALAHAPKAKCPIVVAKLDRLSRSLKDLLHILERVEAVGARFRSLTEAIDTSGPAGRMLMQMLGSFAEFERAMVRERTRAGLKAAAARGRKGGRQPKLTPEQKAEILDGLGSGRKSAADLARLFRVHRATISRLAAQKRVTSVA